MTKLKLTNLDDVAKASEGILRADEVRSLEIEALVDTGATNLVLPADVVAALGVRELGKRKVRYADARVEEVPWVGPLQIEILGRAMIGEALVVAAGATPLIGQIPLENLDLIVDPKSREVSVNPASPDAPLLDILRVTQRRVRIGSQGAASEQQRKPRSWFWKVGRLTTNVLSHAVIGP